MSLRYVLRRISRCNLKTPADRLLVKYTSRRGLSSLTFPSVDVGWYSMKAPYHQDCEDACFIWDNDEVVAFGVADGVSGWKYQGCNPALFPNYLLVNCLNHLENNKGNITPQELIYNAYKDVLDNNQVEAGSSTVCVGILNKQNRVLSTANIGDSGYVVFRDGQAIFKSEDQYIHPNVPFQIGVKEIKDGKSIPHGNSPTDADVNSIQIQPKDIMVGGTDGLFENLFLSEIVDLLTSNQILPGGNIDWYAATKHLAVTAQRRAVSLTRVTPRERRIRKNDEFSLEMPGGNCDDVAIVALHVKGE